MKISSFWGDRVAVSEDCTTCGLHKDCKNPFTEVYGDGEMNTLIVMNSPYKSEEERKAPYSGHAFNVLDKTLSDMGIDPRTAFWKCNALRCYIEKIKDAKVDLCRPHLLKVIKKYKPKHIITVGTFSTNMVIGHMSNTPDMDGLPFNHIPIHEYGAWVHPLYNPGYKNTQNELAYFNRALKEILSEIKLDRPLVKVDPFKEIEVITEFKEINYLFDWMWNDLKEPLFAWDVEATGLKPHWEQQFITSVGMATREGTFAFPLFHDEAYDGHIDKSYEVEKEWMKIMSDPVFKKVAHNRKFDEGWAEVTTGNKVNGGLQCTMTNQHLIDHRAKTKGLKWQAFRRWGIVEYDKRARPYIESDRKGAKELNRMREMPLREQLLYVGADAYLTLKLSDEQDREYAESDNKKKAFPFALFHESTDTLKRLEARGVPVSSSYYEEKTLELVKKMDEAQEVIRTDPGVIKYKNKHRKEFKQTSPVALKEVLFNIKGIDKKLAGRTPNKKVSIDEKSLKDIGDPLCDAILSYRKVFKLHNTYMAQFTRNIVNERIHFNFSLSIPRSYRSSAFDPNLHNIPKHDEYANVTCRSGILPDPGMGLGEMDFKGMEVSTSASYHKDPKFIEYLLDPNADMHRDNTCDLWFLTQAEVKARKPVRHHTKNCWTFPQFYGDWYGSCAPELWKQVIVKGDMALASGEKIVDRLHDNKIHSLDDFLKHCQGVEDHMWNTRFKVYTAWKKEVNDFYIKHGYVETFLGFRFTGLLDTKQTSNYPIQGTAFHLLLWCLNRLDKWAMKEDLKSYIWGQIHDSVNFMWAPDEIEGIKDKMTQICTIVLPNEFDWINVPMGIDIGLSPLREDGGNFSNTGKE